MRDFWRPGRSPVYGTNAMCATSHPAASLAALEIMRDGGSAVDAAIAAAAVLGVVEPQSTGIGGDCFALVWSPDKGLQGYNGSGRAPAAIDVEAVRADAGGADRISETSPHSVTVPGAVEAWQALHKAHGKLDWERLFRPAIHLASNGFAIAPRVSRDWPEEAEKLKLHAATKAQFLPGGKAPAVGDRHAFPQLGETLRLIARQGADGFYRGAVAEEIVATLRGLGGYHALDDFDAHRGAWVDPIACPYGGLDIAQIPPNGHGITTLIMLNILARVKPADSNPASAERYHLLLEAARLAYAVRDTFVADPAQADVPVAHMLSDALADELAGRIDRKRRRDDLGPVPNPPKSDTVYLSVVDSSGMAISFINSLFGHFGCSIATAKSGVMLQNRGSGFVLTPGHRNELAPGKRPLHTIIPAMGMAQGLSGGRPELVFGVMGGQFQPTGQSHVLMSMRQFGLDPQQAIDLPRMFFEGDGLRAEPGIPQATASALTAMGHKVHYDTEPLGGGQMVQIDHARGVLIGASDPRKDGLALGY